MSQLTPHTNVHSPTLAGHRTAIIAALMALLAAGAVIAVIAISNNHGQSSSQPTSVPVTQSVGGPNEAARGQAAATAAGVQPTGGPNEILRGNSASDASR
jgi:hypothetical protein